MIGLTFNVTRWTEFQLYTLLYTHYAFAGRTSHRNRILFGAVDIPDKR